MEDNNKLNKKEAWKGIIVSFIFTLIGLVITLPIFGYFGMLWLVLSFIMMVYYIGVLIKMKIHSIKESFNE